MNSTLKSLVFWMVLVVVALGVWSFSNKFQSPSKAVAFSDFMADVDGQKIEKVTITGQEIAGTYRADKETFHTYAPAQYEGLANKLIAQGILVTAKEPTQSPWAQLLYSWAPILLLIGFWIFFMRQMQSGGGGKAMSFGKSRARLLSDEKGRVTFDDVAGVE